MDVGHLDVVGHMDVGHMDVEEVGNLEMWDNRIHKQQSETVMSSQTHLSVSSFDVRISSIIDMGANSNIHTYTPLRPQLKGAKHARRQNPVQCK